MTQPSDGPAMLSKVKALLGITDGTDDNDLSDVVAAVNATVRRLPCADVDAATWPADVERGANMLGVRLFRRKNTPSGVESFGDNGPIYVRRNDPDIAQLLQLGDYESPMVG
jgi:hypothetical protein